MRKSRETFSFLCGIFYDAVCVYNIQSVPGGKSIFWEVMASVILSKKVYVGMLLSLWLFLFPIFLFAAQPKEFFLDGLKKLEQRSHKCVEVGGDYVEQIHFFSPNLFSL
jgi:hypothetical protein